MLGDSLGDFITLGSKPFSSGRSNAPKLSEGARMNLVKLVFIAGFLVLAASLIKTQIFAGASFRLLSNENRLREVPIHAPRGIIFDREGIALTANLPSFRFENQGISKDQAIVLEVKGQIPEIDSTRSYLKGPAFAHVLGYMQVSVGQAPV